MTEQTPSMQEIMATQGTRLSDVPPWMSYAASLEEKLDPQLEAQIAEYSQNSHHKTSSQAQEELCRQREINEQIAKEYQWLHPSEYADKGPRIGRIMHSSEVINRLRNDCHLKCWYRQHPQVGRITLLIQPREYNVPEVGCWVQHGFMPEYTIMGFDDKGIPLAEKYRGWRTVVLQLILKGAIKEELAHEVFGKASGPASDRYLRTLYSFRNAWLKEE